MIHLLVAVYESDHIYHCQKDNHFEVRSPVVQLATGGPKNVKKVQKTEYDGKKPLISSSLPTKRFKPKLRV